MTISQALSATDSLKPNSYDRATKIAWLSELDATVQKEIHDKHVGGGTFTAYTDVRDGSVTLKIPEPYSVMYIYFLMSKIDFFNSEIGKYNASTELFNSAYAAYRDAYHAAHLPLQNNKITYNV